MAYRSMERKAHWVGANHQNRIPSRWVAFDTEAKKHKTVFGETQEWRLGCAIQWRTDLKTGNAEVIQQFDEPEELWRWVTDFCKPKTRTVVWAHNLGYDTRISRLMDILPTLGWHLDWCNMGANVSTMTWRSEHGTLTFADMYSWLPMPLADIGELVGVPKMAMPPDYAKKHEWVKYCRQDVNILYRAAKEIISFIRTEDLGNWQPTGAGMAFATWRHKFLKHKVLVHDDAAALDAERRAIHTGRAEAWRHGKLNADTWVECDLRQAYVHIARDSELPTKLKWHEGSLTLDQYRALRRWACVLVRAEVWTELPSVPVHHQGRTIWPVGHFTTWLWDCEFDAALESGAECAIREAYVYTRAPILSEWADWVLKTQERTDDEATPAVRKWIKHSGRTLIGRIALRTSQWAVWGTNPEGEAGISYEVDADNGKTYRLMHAGDRTFREEARAEGHDSLPQITGYITAMCRVWLWNAIQAAGEDNIAHVDTDSLHVNVAGLERLKQHYGERFQNMWQLKAMYDSMTVYGPRNYRGDGVRKLAGIPGRAVEVSENRFKGESWATFAGDLRQSKAGVVTLTAKEWHVKASDPRRRSVPGGRTRTAPYWIDQNSKVSSADSVTAA